MFSFTYASFFFSTTASSEFSTLSLHDALPISRRLVEVQGLAGRVRAERHRAENAPVAERQLFATVQRSVDGQDRKSTRLNSSHVAISYAVFCLKKKNKRNLRNIFSYIMNTCKK